MTDDIERVTRTVLVWVAVLAVNAVGWTLVVLAGHGH